MGAPKQSRRKRELEPIDWREFANDAVLNGNMSTLYHRPPTEDPTAYASPEALLEIEKRAGHPLPGEPALPIPIRPTVGPEQEPPVQPPEPIARPTVGPESYSRPTVGSMPTVGLFETPPAPIVDSRPTVGAIPTVGVNVKPIRDVQDALTPAGQILYKAMYGAPDGAKSKNCTKGYRQLAAETHLNKDTVRDLIGELKDKAIVSETETYDPDTRSAKTYEVFSYKSILQRWRDAGLLFVTTGRQRPVFCNAQGDPVEFIPTVGLDKAKKRRSIADYIPTVGLEDEEALGTPGDAASAEVVRALHQITGSPVDQEAAERLIANCREVAADCTMEEILEFAWSKAFLCRSGKIENPIGFLITQVPKHFQGEALKTYRDKKRKELEAAAELAAREEERRLEAERELAATEQRHKMREKLAEKYRKGQGIDVKTLLEDAEADGVLKDWARRMLNLGQRYPAQYD